jgi:lysozyme family protein
MALFEKYAEKLLLLEGGYSNDPADRGGATNMGVTLSTWRRVGYDKDGDGDVDPEDLLRLTHNDVKSVVRCFYWSRWRADEIESQPVAEILVDWLWCSGKWGIILPQQILGVNPDGYAGPKTLSAVNQANPVEFHRQVFERRMQFIRQIVENDPTQGKFLKGWRNRLKQFT